MTEKEYEEAMKDTFRGRCNELQNAIDDLKKCIRDEINNNIASIKRMFKQLFNKS